MSWNSGTLFQGGLVTYTFQSRPECAVRGRKDTSLRHAVDSFSSFIAINVSVVNVSASSSKKADQYSFSDSQCRCSRVNLT